MLSDEVCQSIIELVEDNFTGTVRFVDGRIVSICYEKRVG